MSSGIAIVTSLLPPLQGGPAGQTAELARYLRSKGVDVSIVLVGNQSELEPIAGVQVTRYRLPNAKVPGLAAILSFVYAIGYLARRRPRMVHMQVFNNPPSWGFGLACRLFGIPSYCKVASEGGVAKQLSRNLQTDWRYLQNHVARSDWWFCRVANYVLATTETFQTILAKKYSIPEERVFYFPNFTAPIQRDEAGEVPMQLRDDIDGCVSHVWTIVTIARGVRQKNFEGCLAAARQLRDSNIRFTWRFVGDFAVGYREELQRKIDLEKLNDFIVFVGAKNVEGVRGELQSADVFVMLSHFEWFGISVIEAMDCGVPVVVSDVPGMGEIVYGCGEAVDAGNAERVADSIRKLLMDCRYREQCIELARQRVDEKYRVRVSGDKLNRWLIEHSAGPL